MARSAAEEVAELRRQLPGMIETAIARIFLSSQLANASEIGEDDAVESADENDPDSTQRGQRPVTRVEPWGIRGRAPAKLRTVSLRLGSSNVLLLGILPTEGYGPQDLGDGEVAVYNKVENCGLRLNEDGSADLDAGTGATTNINGTTYHMPQWDDYITALQAFLSGLEGATTLANVVTAATSFDSALVLANNFKSTKAKNG